MHIAIVDSSRVVLKLIAEMLEPRGHDLVPFTDSAEALAYVGATPSVSALITSLEVRPIGGMELCWSARLLGDARRPLSIIVMSSTRSTQTLAEALDSGADDFIDKPPSPEELHARLRAAERLTTMQTELIRLAETDPLTGLLNRRAFMSRAQQVAAGEGTQMAAILLDIDHFKRINDSHGHDIGDAAIRAVAELVAGQGIAGRLGGEEFALVMPHRGLGEAQAVAERLRRRAGSLRVLSDAGPVHLTCSFGVSARNAAESVECLLKAADVALYAAKASGRNRVVAAEAAPLLARAG